MLSLQRSVPSICSGSYRDIRPTKRRCLSSAPRPPFKILFFGADNFSCITLETLYEARKDLIQHLVVVTPPDQRTGRRLKEVHRPPLRLLAESLSLPSIALPQTLLKDWNAKFLPPPSLPSSSPLPNSLLLTASFGHLLPSRLLSKFLPLNTLNLHPSLLPRYRGAAPIQWSIMNGDVDLSPPIQGEGIGVTIQELSRGKFDQGRILSQTPITDYPPSPDFITLEKILAKKGGELLVEVLRDFERFQIEAKGQDKGKVSQAPKLRKETARVKWEELSAVQVTRLQRGLGHQYPLWTTLPSSSTELPPTQLQLIISPSPRTLSLSTIFPSSPDLPPPGSLFQNPSDKHLYITTTTTTSSSTGFDDGKENVVKVEKVKKEGGKWIDAKEWWNGTGRKMVSREKGWVRLE
ncbi:hypothetical protein JCM16303_006386 [Sporobolomyces ruberrimus]